MGNLKKNFAFYFWNITLIKTINDLKCFLIFFIYRVEFETFDILTDEEVRQGLKSYSDWPTYPQVYVKGELIGGLDIIQELRSSGELLKTLNPPMEQNK